MVPAIGGPAPINFFGAALEVGIRRRAPELMPQAHGHAPVRHGAVGISGGDLLELLFGFFVPEGVQQRNAALEGLLDVFSAGDWEVDGAELRGGEVFVVVVVVVILGDDGEGEEGTQEQE